jgi:hypothetical protein
MYMAQAKKLSWTLVELNMKYTPRSAIPEAASYRQFHECLHSITSSHMQIESSRAMSYSGIDKNLAHRAMTSKRVDADWWDMHAEAGLFLVGVGTSLILMALIGLIWWMVPR